MEDAALGLELVDTTDFCGFMQQDRTPEGSSQLSENPLHVNGVTSRVPKMSEEAERLKALVIFYIHCTIVHSYLHFV